MAGKRLAITPLGMKRFEHGLENGRNLTENTVFDYVDENPDAGNLKGLERSLRGYYKYQRSFGSKISKSSEDKAVSNFKNKFRQLKSKGYIKSMNP